MSEPSISALGRGAPSTIQSEPTSSEPPPAEPLACADPSARLEGTGGAGAEALVRRFSGTQGAGPGSPPPVVPPNGPSCGDDALRAAGACGIAVLAATSTGGMAALFGGMVCAGAIGGTIECLATSDQASNTEGEP